MKSKSTKVWEERKKFFLQKEDFWSERENRRPEDRKGENYLLDRFPSCPVEDELAWWTERENWFYLSACVYVGKSQLIYHPMHCWEIWNVHPKVQTGTPWVFYVLRYQHASCTFLSLVSVNCPPTIEIEMQSNDRYTQEIAKKKWRQMLADRHNSMID